MKSIGFKTFLLFLIILFQGCMPDSLTKFKQEQKPQLTVTGGSTTQDTAPSGLSYSGSPYQFTVTNPIVTQSPSVTGVVNSYSISPTLPAGLAFDTTTGSIAGTPTVFSVATNYVITATNTAGTTNTTINITTLNQPAGLKYNLRPTAIITMSSTGGLSVGGTFTTASGSGTIKQLSGNIVEVEITTDFVVLGEAVTETTGSAFTIDELDYKNAIQVFPVNTADIASFSVGEYVSTPATQGSSLGVVKQLLSDSIVIDMIRGTFAPTETLDDVSTYAATAMTVEKINFVLNSGDSIDLRPTVTAGESIEYKLDSGDLPAGFSAYDEATGFIIGNYSSSQSTLITASAENPVGSSSATFTMGPLVASPQYLSVTQNVVLKVLGTSDFEYGKFVSTPDGDKARVIQVIDSEYMYVKVIKGSFERDESLDNTAEFGGEKTSVLDLKNVSFVLEVPDGGAATFARDGYISSDAGGLGIVSHIFADGANPDQIFIRQTFPGFSAIEPGTAVNIDNTQTYAASATTITRVRANNLELTLDSVASFTNGQDITYENGSIYASGWIHDVNSSASTVTLNVNREGFHWDANVDNENPLSGTVADITRYRADNTIYMTTTKEIRLNTTLLAGNDITYSISPDLPPGVTLDTESGVISGAPELSSVKKSYTLTATNTVGGVPQSTTFNFNIKVYDVFSLENATANASSYVLHRLGKGNEIAECKMTQDQINGSNQAAKDITCMLEGGELDIFQQGLQTKVFASKGLCKYTEIRPYGFWQYPVKKTTLNNIKFDVTGECTGGTRNYANTTSTDFRCHGNYAADTNFDGGPNCDSGKYTVVTVTNSDADSDGTCDSETIETSEAECGGEALACFAGSQADTFSVAQLKSGVRSTLTTTSTGGSIDYSVTSPQSSNLISNRKIANYTASNTCSTTDNYNYNNESWRSYNRTMINSVTGGRVLTGTITTTQYSAAVAGVGTLFTQELVPGDTFYDPSGEAYVVRSITNDTSLTLTNRINTAIAGQAITLSPYADPFLNGGEPYYEFSCLDAAFDTIGRIRLMVRDWDRDFKVTDRIDQLTVPLTGTMSTTAGSTAATGTSLDTEVISKRIIQVGTEVNTVDVVNNATSLDFYLTSVATNTTQAAWVRPILSDAGESTDLFGNFYNNRSDWDDDRNIFLDYGQGTYSSTAYYPSLNGCAAAVNPSQADSPGGAANTKERRFDYRFPFDRL